MSTYQRAMLALAGGAIAGITIVWVLPLGLTAWGLSGRWTWWTELLLAALWLLIGGFVCIAIRCPRCSKSIFMRGIFAVWPQRICSRCGEDLSAAETITRERSNEP